MRRDTPARPRRYFAFLCVLWLPLLAALLSPQIGAFAGAIWRDPRSFDAELNRLRQKTPLWNGAIALYNRALYAAGASGRPGVAEIGSGGWIFLGDLFNRNFSQALRRRVLDDGELTRWLETFDLQGKWLEARHIPYAFVVAPAKWSIYPDRLPWWARSLPATPRSFDRVLAAAGPRPLLDVRPALREARNHVETYSPLNSHWTDYGGWVAWRQIAGELPQRIPGLPPLAVPSAEPAGVVDEGNEFAGMINLPATNEWTTYRLHDALPDEVVQLADGSESALGGGTRTDLLDLPRIIRNDHANNRLRVLILRDSSGNALSPFLQNAFYLSYQVDHRLSAPGTWPNLAGLVEEFRPDLVLWVMTERYFDAPLGDTEYWRAANAYDCAGAGGDVWPGPDAARSIGVSASAPAEHLKMTLPPSPAARVLRVRLHAAAKGSLSLASAGLQRTAFYSPGRNELFLHLDPAAESKAVDLAGEAGSGAAIDELELRPLGTNCADAATRP